MEFRKDALNMRSDAIGLGMLLFSALFMTIVYPSWICIVCDVLFTVQLFTLNKKYDEYIRIDETGIVCYKSKTMLWNYQWDEIVELKRCTYLRHPAVAIVPQINKILDGVYQSSNHRFQLSKSAKRAIAEYKTGDGLRKP